MGRGVGLGKAGRGVGLATTARNDDLGVFGGLRVLDWDQLLPRGDGSGADLDRLLAWAWLLA
jgi:hypothetical protein